MDMIAPTDAFSDGLSSDEWIAREEQACLDEMNELATRLHSQRKIFAWLSNKPDIGFGSLMWHWLEDPATPCRRIIRFSLIDGGQLTYIEEFRHLRNQDGSIWGTDGKPHIIGQFGGQKLIATAHAGEAATRYRGHVEHVSGKGESEGCCAAEAFVFGPATTQDVANRVAKTFALTNDFESDNFYALLDSSTGCALCARPLRDEISKLVGVGPECARQHGIPHNMEAASRRLKLRRELLGEETMQ